MSSRFREYFAAIVSGDIDAFRSYLSERVSFRAPNGKDVQGPDDVIDFWRSYFGAPPEISGVAEGENHAFARFHSENGSEGIVYMRLDARQKLDLLEVLAGGTVEAEWQMPVERLWGLPKGLEITGFSEAKRVSKHWGYELWLVHEHSPFACKLISLKAGTRTSLQYHRKKEEANMLLQGRVRVHGSANPEGPTKTWEIGPGTIVYVRPGTVHRMEALTDAVFIEVSTLELDDVVRIQDDWNRSDGRLEEEHVEKKRKVSGG